MLRGVIFRQLFEKVSSTYTYIIACQTTRECAIIDPVKECAERDASIVRQLGLTCRTAINTHCHADHVTGTFALKKLLPGLKSYIARASGAAADELIDHGRVIPLGPALSLVARATPGHTDGCMSFVLSTTASPNVCVFTGDTLLIRGCGRTDFQQGSAANLFRSVQEQLFTLPDDCIVFPAHNYVGLTSSTIGEEKQFNPRLKLGTSQSAFEEIMAGLNLPPPTLLDVAVPANLRCGSDAADVGGSASGSP